MKKYAYIVNKRGEAVALVKTDLIGGVDVLYSDVQQSNGRLVNPTRGVISRKKMWRRWFTCKNIGVAIVVNGFTYKDNFIIY